MEKLAAEGEQIKLGDLDRNKLGIFSWNSVVHRKANVWLLIEFRSSLTIFLFDQLSVFSRDGERCENSSWWDKRVRKKR